ncbi:ribosome hibernation-promoting factor, HPF/YfiA family [Tepidamorphus sp. 3E244]|uniref:ribosome hibernation-promoting factor, HPF/YfiA family n=1 Tax=Tepidamorphus sp. 3E244 TaxID=3385498 RepID=UPI0038FC0BFF
MTLRVIGKNIDVGDALRERAEERVTAMLEKYFSHGYSGKVALEKTGQSFKADFSIHLDSGIDLQAEGEGEDAYRSLDAAAERLEKRLRRYKRRLKDHHNGRAASEPVIAPSFVLAEVDEEDETVAGTDEAPLVVAESSTKIRTQTVGMAAMALDLSTEPVVVFLNAANGRLNIVYRRTDGNIGWIDPPAADKA